MDDQANVVGARPSAAERPQESGAAALGRGGRMSRQRKTAAVLRRVQSGVPKIAGDTGGALSAAGLWHRRRSEKSERRGTCVGLRGRAAGEGRTFLATPHPLNHGALRSRGPFSSVELITRAHEAVKQRQDSFHPGLLMARSSHPFDAPSCPQYPSRRDYARLHPTR